MPSSGYSERNFVNSIAVWLADKALAAGFLIYWRKDDLVETLDGVYKAYSLNQETYLANATFAARLAAASAILAIRFGEIPAVPTYVTRPTTDGRITDSTAMPVPMLAISVSDPLPLGGVELGTSKQWYFRRLLIHGFARDGFERGNLNELFIYDWFRPDVEIPIKDHVSGTLAAIDTARVVSPRCDRDTAVDGAEATTYEFFFNAGLEYQT